ncbi:MAG: hypothetical protein HC869_10860 [Rhodospirillales bacterium]|nr:hypothetical protein [Rhodospirillales bacterium]
MPRRYRMKPRVLTLSMAFALLLAAGWAWPDKHAAEANPRHATATASVPVPHRVHSRSGPLARARSKLVELETAPFPYSGLMPGTQKPFLDVIENGRRGHRTGAGRIYWEDETYSDRQVLLHIPKGFDIRRPSVIIVFFHGHGAKLADDVYLRQQFLRRSLPPASTPCWLPLNLRSMPRIQAPASSGNPAHLPASSAKPRSISPSFTATRARSNPSPACR